MIKWIKSFFRKNPAHKFTGFEIRFYRRGVLMHETISVVTSIHDVRFPIEVVMPDEGLRCSGFMLCPRTTYLEREESVII